MSLSHKKLMTVLRSEFNHFCLSRDKHCCVMCKRRGLTLGVHHIVDRHLMPNDGYTHLNGITLCDEKAADGSPSCHLKAESYHINKGRAYTTNFHPLDLLAKIGSSVERAWAASVSLSDYSGTRLLMIVDKEGVEQHYCDGQLLTTDEAVLEAMLAEERAGVAPKAAT